LLCTPRLERENKNGKSKKKKRNRTKSNWFQEQISVFIVLSYSPSAMFKVIMQQFENVTVTYEVMPRYIQAGLGAARLSSAISKHSPTFIFSGEQ